MSACLCVYVSVRTLAWIRILAFVFVFPCSRVSDMHVSVTKIFQSSSYVHTHTTHPRTNGST